MLYVGLDVHARLSAVCILDEGGRKVKRATIRGGWSKMLAWLDREIDGPYAICYEASCGYGALYDRLRRRTRRVLVAHPGKLRLIWGSKRKTDRIDARKLAQLLLLDAAPPVHVPSPEVRDWRRLIEFRRKLIADRTAKKNRLRTLLRRHGLCPPMKSLWTKRGLAWLASLALPGEAAPLERDMVLSELAGLDVRLKRVTAALDRRAASHPGVMLLQTIPGVGPRTAEAVMAYVDDADRFRSSRQVGAYFGLVPRQDQSASVNRLGHVTKEGPASVRQLVVEATWQLIRYSPTARSRFERLHGGKKERRKVALVGVARWLLGCMHAMLRTGECWRESAPAKAAAA